MRIEQSFSVRRPPDEVFAYMVEPANLASWQT
jgi:carbon monoxide dehydrogenase subunit G